MKRLLYIILYIGLAVHASAQVRVTGQVTALSPSSGGSGGGLKPVSDVIVKLMNGTKTLAFTSSNAQGVYSLEVKNAPTGEVTLQFNHIGYEKESERLTLKEKITKLDMLLTPKNISLKEVTVKATPLWQRGDTLSHNLASFLGKGDVTLEDGLKRLPGVDVAKSGAISYMGTPISQFNIEGLDLLGGKYNLATRNIPANYVTQVEIVRRSNLFAWLVQEPPQPTGGERRAKQRGVDEHQTGEEGEVQAIRTGRSGGKSPPDLAQRGGP